MERKTVAVLGMMCAGCAANVERKLNALDGIGAAAVNLSTRTVMVDYDPARVSLQQMKEALSSIGYDMVIEQDRNVEAIEHRALSMLRRKVALSWLFVLLCMALSMGWIGQGLTADYRNQLCLIIALLNIVYCGRQFYVTAWRQLLHGSANMDTLVALSTCISFLFSTFNTFWGDNFWTPRGIDNHTYFDASVMIITFVLTGRLLEERAKQGTASSIRSLMGLQPKTAHLVTPPAKPSLTDLMSGNTPSASAPTPTDIPIAAVQPGDILEVRPGEKIPVDGLVCCISDATAPTSSSPLPPSPSHLHYLLDESMMTGEAALVEKHPGDRLLAGTIVKGTALRMRAETVGEQTVLANMIRMVQQAQGSKAPVQRLVDRIALIFVPTVIALSLLTFLLWLLIGGTVRLPQAILSAVSVLVIACPCAMGLATPTALMVGIGKAAQQGILIKDATALEQLRKVDAMVLDKTGTLTIHNSTFPSPRESVSSMLRCQRNPHEHLRPHARETVAQLKTLGITPYMMSGDSEERVSHWAAAAGISHYHSKALPQDKEDLVRQLQAQGRVVAMVGDGINDSQALASADVSIAMGRGTDVAMDVAQVTLMTDDLRRIPQAVSLSKQTVGMIHQNLFWAFIYNMVCIPLAAGLPWLFGVHWQITPMLASALMAFSSVSVVLNSLRLKLAK